MTGSVTQCPSLADNAAISQGLDTMTSEAFSNLKDSVIL